ncbi:MAG: hypothetical protein ACRCYQ_17140 [Nocardioides sp.]
MGEFNPARQGGNTVTSIEPLEPLQQRPQFIGAGEYNGSQFPRVGQLAQSLLLEIVVTYRFGISGIDRTPATLVGVPETERSAHKVIIELESDLST